MNCNLELRLSPPTPETGESHQEKQLTILYNGQICVADVTEIQARAIILEASKQMERRRYNDRNCIPNLNAYNSQSKIPISPASQMCCGSPVSSSSPELSMKKSLQRFLHKRRQRQLATSPYGIVRFCSSEVQTQLHPQFGLI